MGKGYNHHHHHQFQYQQNLKNYRKSNTFMPMLCSRTCSIKDVVVALPILQQDRSPSSVSSSSSKDPFSPKIGCMGQLKGGGGGRGRGGGNNKITGFPTTTMTTGHNNNNIEKLPSTTKSGRNDNIKHFKLKRIFSARNIIDLHSNSNNSNTNNITSCAVSSSCRTRRRDVSVTTEKDVFINIAEMDPPLPVMMNRVPKPPPAAAAAADCGGDGIKNNIWKRRSNGVALKSLELQNIRIPRHHQVDIQTV